MKERIAWIDIAKGIGILCVIWGHLCDGIIRKEIYSFHMPLFFFLSGYVFPNQDIGFLFKNKLKRFIKSYFFLVVPILGLDVLTNIHNSNINSKYFVELIRKYFFQIRLPILWFLSCLFFLNIIFALIVYKRKSDFLIGIQVCLLSIAGLLYYKYCVIALPWNIDICFTALPFFYAGYCYQRYKKNIDRYTDTVLKKGIVCMVFVGLNITTCYAGWKIFNCGLEMYFSSYGYWPITYFAAFSGIGAVVYLAQLLKNRFLQTIGESSLIFFGWHGLLITIISIVLKRLGIFQNIYNGFEKVFINIFFAGFIIGVLYLINIFIVKNLIKMGENNDTK